MNKRFLASCLCAVSLYLLLGLTASGTRGSDSDSDVKPAQSARPCDTPPSQQYPAKTLKAHRLKAVVLDQVMETKAATNRFSSGSRNSGFA